MNYLDRIQPSGTPMPFPTGTKEEVGAALILRYEEMDRKAGAEAIQAEREGDTDGTWMCMAARAQFRRFIEKIKADLEKDRLKKLTSA